MTVTRRPVVESDTPLLFALYSSTRQEELSLVPWSAAQKQAFLEMQFAGQVEGYRTTHPGATHEMICLDGRPVGRIYWDLQPARLHILDITIAPESRNQGIGSTVLNQFLGSTPVTIYVESFNRSLRLFDRLGFRPISVDGFLVLLERQ